MDLQGNHPDVQYSNIPDWNIPIVRVDILESRQKTFLHFPSLNNTCVFPFPRACPITITVTPCPSFEICTHATCNNSYLPPLLPKQFHHYPVSPVKKPLLLLKYTFPGTDSPSLSQSGLWLRLANNRYKWRRKSCVNFSYPDLQFRLFKKNIATFISNSKLSNFAATIFPDFAPFLIVCSTFAFFASRLLVAADFSSNPPQLPILTFHR